MKDNHSKTKKQVVHEVLGSVENENMPENEPAKRGTYTKPIILQSMIESFDHFRLGMDKLANAYMLMQTVDPELHRKMSRFGEAMSKMLDGYAKMIKQQGGTIEDTTKPEALQKYFGQQGMSALGMNENKEQVFNARLNLQIGRIKSIIKNTKR